MRFLCSLQLHTYYIAFLNSERNGEPDDGLFWRAQPLKGGAC